LYYPTTGERTPLGAIVDDGVALMWKKYDDDKKVWKGPVSGIKSTFHPKEFPLSYSGQPPTLRHQGLSKSYHVH
jgi:hypothetical protein